MYTQKSGIDEQRVGWKRDHTISIFYPTNSASIPLFQCKFIIPLLLFLSSPGKLSDMLRLCDHDSSITVNTGAT